MPRFLHLAPEIKFIAFAQKAFEQAFPGENQFRVFRYRSNAPRLVVETPQLRIVRPRHVFSREFATELRRCECLVVHYMLPWSARAILRAPANALTVWAGWGADYYQLLGRHLRPTLLPETQALTNSLRRHRTIKSRIANQVRELGWGALVPGWKSRIIPRIDVMSALPQDYQQLKANVPRFRARFHQLDYYSTEEVFRQGPTRMEGPDILLGNSASASNNHLEAMTELAALDLAGRKVIVPLSYGDPRYANAVCEWGTRLLGRHFVPLRNFVPLEEFNELISSCSIVVMNHVRQQAMGTVSSALYKGAKVFFREENPLFGFYRDKGVAIASVNRSGLAGKDAFSPLAPNLQQRNRELLDAYWNMAAVVARTRELAEIIDDTHRQGNEHIG